MTSVAPLGDERQRESLHPHAVTQALVKITTFLLFVLVFVAALGKTGKKILNDTLKEWDLEYEEKKSLTSDNSFILNIKKIKKKIS